MSQPPVYPSMEGQQAVPPPAYSQPPPAYSQPGQAPPPYNPNSGYQGEPHKIGGGGEPVYYVPPNQQHQQAQPMQPMQQQPQPAYTYSPNYPPPPQPQPAPVFYGQPGAPGGPVPSPYSQPAGMPPSGPVYFSQPPVQQIAYVRAGPQRVAGGAMCGRCRLVYPLPPGAHSWRCKGCNEMNNLQGDQCTIM